jgi:hypothetical protein
VSGRHSLIPHPRILEPPQITHHQRTREGLACRQDYRPVVFYNPLVLLPKGFKGDDGVPFTGGRSSSIGQIAQHHINALVFDIFHCLKTICFDKAIRCQLPYVYNLLYIVKDIHESSFLLAPIPSGQYQLLLCFPAMIQTVNYQAIAPRHYTSPLS